MVCRYKLGRCVRDESVESWIGTKSVESCEGTKSVESWGGTKSVESLVGTKSVESLGGTTSVESWGGTSVESWVGTNNLIFCSGYNTPTLFWNLQKRSLLCREYGLPQTCKPQCSTVRLCVL